MRDIFNGLNSRLFQTIWITLMVGAGANQISNALDNNTKAVESQTEAIKAQTQVLQYK